MSEKEELSSFHNRKNPRLKAYDYATPNYYFVTICTWDKACIFGLHPQFSRCGEVAIACLEEISLHFPGVTVDKWVVMPNHVHAIVILPGTVKLPTVIGAYKSAVARRIHTWNPELRIWRSSFHDHVIRNQADYERIWSYIDTNPARWMDDCFYTPQPEQ